MTITAQMVKELRQKTGAGMMDCKKALEEKSGNMEAAIQYLREKGVAEVAKRAGRAATEGLIGSYVHTGGKIGVLVEVNCETDFVARTEDFKELVKNLAMQVCSENPVCVRREEVPPGLLEREQQIYATQASQSGKPEKVIERIVAGKLESFYARACLLEQEFIRDRNITVQDYVNSKAAKLGENIVVRRFVRFQLGDEA
ncbi:MAG: translation elongation factor Ts [Candidatus Abyssobacteria bacterium SURF_17]|uniref:Elongation factor Ts n=1 Tax=Candidatus Abyssobacteria bacterium SURF_17 TaxID=2093361 RepID=A0A419EX34_9BACT|nr:MAG: translation elongation factor Ts [Candidatus Abyssubacteria bacterium SURF_17]